MKSLEPKIARDVEVDQVVWVQDGALSHKVRRVAKTGRFQWLRLHVIRNDNGEDVPGKLGRCHINLSAPILKFVYPLLAIIFLASCTASRTNVEAQEAFGLSYGVGTPFHTIQGD